MLCVFDDADEKQKWAHLKYFEIKTLNKVSTILHKATLPRLKTEPQPQQGRHKK
jgi:hypothetical protein